MADTRLYSLTLIVAAAILGGPLAGTYTIYSNFLAFHREKAARLTITIGLLATLLLFCILQAVPTEMLEKVPSTLLPLLYSSVIFLVAKHFQEKALDEAFLRGVPRQGLGRTAFVSLVALLVSILLMIPPMIVSVLLGGES